MVLDFEERVIEVAGVREGTSGNCRLFAIVEYSSPFCNLANQIVLSYRYLPPLVYTYLTKDIENDSVKSNFRDALEMVFGERGCMPAVLTTLQQVKRARVVIAHPQADTSYNEKYLRQVIAACPNMKKENRKYLKKVLSYVFGASNLADDISDCLYNLQLSA